MLRVTEFFFMTNRIVGPGSVGASDWTPSISSGASIASSSG